MSADFTSIFNIIIDATVDHLTNELIIATTDETKIGLLRFGKLQADPTDADRGLNILVRSGGEEWPDELYIEEHGIIAPTYEIGGTQYWMRRFIIELILFYDGEEDRQNARKKAVVIASHAHKAMFEMPVPQGHDSFNEAVDSSCQIRKMTQVEAGGEGTFIWRSHLYVEWLTVITRGNPSA